MIKSQLAMRLGPYIVRYSFDFASVHLLNANNNKILGADLSCLTPGHGLDVCGQHVNVLLHLGRQLLNGPKPYYYIL